MMTNEEQIKKLNEFMDKFIKEHPILSKINDNVIPQEPQPGQIYHALNIYTDQNSWQEIPVHEEDAYELKKPVAGSLKDELVMRKPRLKRILLGYIACSRAAQDYNQFKKLMNAITIQTLHELEEHYGFNYNDTTTGKYYLNFELPGMPGCYFRDMENYAAFEMRAISDCVKTNLLKGTLK